MTERGARAGSARQAAVIGAGEASAPPAPRGPARAGPAVIRAVDVCAAAAALALLSPLLLAVAAILRSTGEGEVFYRQQRVGLGGRTFGMWKFATMLRDSAQRGAGPLTLRDDPRVLPVGRVLRRTKINELPQLLNVLSGDMSLIGPRPQSPPHFEVYAEDVRAALGTVRPGLSGIASILFRDEERLLARAADPERFYADVIAPYKGEVERWYVERRDLGLYLALIAITVWVVLLPRSRAWRRLLRDLPAPPPELSGW